MNFFAQQELARRNSWRLVVLYGIAAVAVLASYCAAGALLYAAFGLYELLPLAGNAPLVWRGLLPTYFDALLRVPLPVLAGIALLVGGPMLAVSAYRLWLLGEGGAAVAHLLGARYVDPGRCTPEERRLQNVVEEMAIASGIAVPPVYVLERDDAVNALVAGYSPNEAVIVVTRGALQRLSRDELQGVMGHEYSHILNGDMALNVRLASVLAGLSWLGDRGEEIVWHAARRSRSRDHGGTSGSPALLGALLAFVGFPGVYAADWIKAAISRERERLADAASVQFTRNPDGIAGALDSILSTRSHTSVQAAHARELSHMFFAPVAGRWWSFPTHPPIEERIRRAHPRFDRDAYRERRHGTRREVAVLDGAGEVVKILPFSAAGAALGSPTARHVDHAARLLERIPSRLREALRRADEAEFAMFALALGRDPARHKEAFAALQAGRGAGAVAPVAQLRVYVATIARSHMLILAELAVPPIKEQAQACRDRFLADLAAMIEADRPVVRLSRFVLLTFLRQRLREGAGQPIPTQFRSLDELGAEVHAVLSLVACGAGSDSQQAYERGAAVLKLALPAPLARERLDTALVRDALERLRRVAPFKKPALLKACFEAAAADGVIRVAEAEIVRMVAAALDCPVPPLLAAHDPEALAA